MEPSALRDVAEPWPLRGIELRYAVTDHLARVGSATVAEVVAALEADGFRIQGRASKAVSDALRWEVGRGRAVRVSRGVYRVGWMPSGTAHRIRTRVAVLRAPRTAPPRSQTS